MIQKQAYDKTFVSNIAAFDKTIGTVIQNLFTAIVIIYLFI